MDAMVNHPAGLMKEIPVHYGVAYISHKGKNSEYYGFLWSVIVYACSEKETRR